MTTTPAATPDWPQAWAEAARLLGEHHAVGRGHLLTEDTLRLCVIEALATSGVGPERLAIEVYSSVLAGGKVDLVVDDIDGTVIELKYPRGSRSGGTSPDTMTFGELIRDFLRVAVVPAADRWVVQVLEPKLRDYLRRRLDVTFMWRAGERFTLSRDALGGLPKTALDAIGPTPWLLPLDVECVVAVPVDVDLALFAYRVAAPQGAVTAAPLQMHLPPREGNPQAPRMPASESWPGTAKGHTPGGARAEILAAVHALTTRSGRAIVTVQEVVDELRRNGTRYAESTVRTMMTSHMCAQVHGDNIGSYDDLDRVDRGTYQLRKPSPGSAT